MFIIKYEIFEDDILELREIDFQTFNQEYNQIYGCFTIIVNGIEYLPYPSSEMKLETKRIYSELILTHFDFLIDVYYQLPKNNYVALKYIENHWTWLEFIQEGTELIVSELNYETHEGSWLQTDRRLFINAIKEDIINERIQWEDFEKELISKIKEFLNTIQELNESILASNCFKQIRSFALDH